MSEKTWVARAAYPAEGTGISLPEEVTGQTREEVLQKASELLEGLCSERRDFREHFPDGIAQGGFYICPL